MFAVLESHEVVEYYPDETSAYNCAIDLLDREDSRDLMVVQIIEKFKQ
jgi:hypothetical protein